ncbi:hypothetical protein ACJJIE_00865 [Microbulbifer sp. TRSA001]|uniref:hypothetical protein n=1 Tax=Microbulbifer sp. TRSA001 TaxID=3243381 RepID=UPI00403917ED
MINLNFSKKKIFICAVFAMSIFGIKDAVAYDNDVYGHITEVGISQETQTLTIYLDENLIGDIGDCYSNRLRIDLKDGAAPYMATIAHQSIEHGFLVKVSYDDGDCRPDKHIQPSWIKMYNEYD